MEDDGFAGPSGEEQGGAGAGGDGGKAMMGAASSIVSMAFPEVGMIMNILTGLLGGCGNDQKNEENSNKTHDQQINDYDVQNDERTNEDQKQALQDIKDQYQSLNGDFSQAGRMGPGLQEVGDTFNDPAAGSAMANKAQDLEQSYNETQQNENENQNEQTNEQETNDVENEDLDNEA
ncbi:hypothetical protein HDU97_003811 [Phlyctochytrium planicorne]|nr:hypothetical protein HDU97_003811 [Phlyctochytrium planicorne]